MKSVSNFVDLWDHYVKPRWSTPEGLGFALLCALVAWSGMFTFFASNFSNRFGSQHKLEIFVLGAGSILTLIVVAWFASRRIPRFDRARNEIGILLGIPVQNSTMKAELKQVAQELDGLVREHLNAKIKIKSLPYNHLPVDHEHAHLIRVKSNASLVIWGNAAEGTVNGGKQFKISVIRFSWVNASLSREHQEQLFSDIAVGVSGRVFMIDEKNTLEGIESIRDHLYETSMFIVAVLQGLDKQWALAVELFSRLLIRLDRPAKMDPAFRKTLVQRTKRLYGVCAENYVQTLAFGFKDRHDEITAKIVKDNVEIAKRFYPESPSPYFVDARLSVHKGDIKAAKTLIQAAKKKSQGYAAAYLSAAFLDLISGHFQSASREYRRAFQRDIDATVLLSVLDFIEEYYESNPEQHVLLFSLGILNVHLYDKARGIEYLDRFFKFAGTDEKYAVLVTHANEVLVAAETGASDEIPAPSAS